MVIKRAVRLKVQESYILPTEPIYVFVMTPPPQKKKNSDLIFLYKIYRIVFKPKGSVFTARYEWNLCK
jgi:hypothetical protein